MKDKIVKVGRQAALAAGAVLRLNYLKPHEVHLKGVIDPVTETDLQAQDIIVRIIRQGFPDHGFLAEESEGQGTKEFFSSGAKPDRWIIDPLDGTVNYAHGFPMFCVSIAFEAEGVLQYGVIYDPLREELFEAIRGGGARLNGQAVRVSGTELMDRALMATGFPYDIRERLPQTMARLSNMLALSQGVRRAGSAALDMAYVACGRFDGFYEENLKPWDTAAGLLLITEAGGHITTFDGRPYNIFSPNIAASNGRLHRQLLEALKV
jgi:myo-inositol-1(or 4)-monophosphatase|uniref:Inositol-1-monophosphatase n=1 Tax=Desulfobacca acetoxidans TaxID=60893 RepID=A0A7C3Z3Q6_9BACT